MNNTSKENSKTPTDGKRIYTKLKFIKSDETGALISFVSQNPKDGRICGVRQESPYPKKICVVDKMLVKDALLNVLYDCTLIPMAKCNGYVVIEMEPVQFKATVETTYVKNSIYLVEVKFGNKTIKFDPFDGKRESVRSLPICKKVLAERVDVRDLMHVMEDFEVAANNILLLMNNDKFKKIRMK